MGSGLSIPGHKNRDATAVYLFSENDRIGQGSGSGSIVYKAKLLQHGRIAMDQATIIPETVAIKVVDKTIKTAHEIDAALQESKFLSKFQHCYAVKLYEFYETPTKLYLVMEYLKGGNLYQRIEERGPLSETQAAMIMVQLASVIATMANSNYVHRDIRGDNVLFQGPGHCMLRLINFGATISLRKIAIQREISFHGSKRFMAPELLDGCVTTQMDVWSLGVLLFFILSGTFPFPCEQNQKIDYDTLSGKFDFHHPVWKSVSGEAKALISKLLTVNPEKRMNACDIISDPWIKKCSALCLECALNKLDSPEGQSNNCSESHENRDISLSPCSSENVITPE